MASRESSAPRVSVVIPNYPDATLIVETLESIDEPSAIEVVVVDDGSPVPGTVDALTELRDRGLITTLIPLEQNQGHVAAINRGIDAATAPYVFIIGNDDLLFPGALSQLADALDDDPDAWFALGGIERFGNDSGVYYPPPMDAWRVTQRNRWVASYLARKDAFTRIGGLSTRTLFEDWDAFMSFAERDMRGVVLPILVYRYRTHGHGRLWGVGRRQWRAQYRLLRAAHPTLFAREAELRRQSPAPLSEKLRARPVLWFRMYRPVFVTEAIARLWSFTRRLRGGGADSAAAPKQP